ncbi:MAG: NAD(P)/FAD-dependent oxidoreductase [Methanosarcinaceae archaeon]|nr:NAD(P)/FAD-dependent oxidoreductase [Methanosarcinaceae archaeon]
MSFFSDCSPCPVRKEYDVIVVGAGPAGSAAAEYAAASGVSVLLIDRHQEIGTPVRCGGFVPESGELRSLIPGFEYPVEMDEIPERCILNRTSVQRVFSPDMHQISFGVNGLVLDRHLFDAWLCGKACEAGADLLCGTTVRQISGNRLTLNGIFGKKEVSGKVIIGADGPHSSVAAAAGLLHRKRTEDPRHLPERGLGFEYRMTGVNVDQDALEMYFGNETVPGGYAWIFPEGDGRANVGVGIRPSLLSRERSGKADRSGKSGRTGEPAGPGGSGAALSSHMSAKSFLNRFITSHPAASEKLKGGRITGIVSGVIPVDGAPEKTVAELPGGGCVMIAGDAAGHVLATNGGGIPFAASAGMIAGKTAADLISGNAVPDDYEKRWRASFGDALDASVRSREMLDRFMVSDRMMNAAFRLLPPGSLKEMQCGHMPGSLRKALSLIFRCAFTRDFTMTSLCLHCDFTVISL